MEWMLSNVVWMSGCDEIIIAFGNLWQLADLRCDAVRRNTCRVSVYMINCVCFVNCPDQTLQTLIKTVQSCPMKTMNQKAYMYVRNSYNTWHCASRAKSVWCS